MLSARLGLALLIATAQVRPCSVIELPPPLWSKLPRTNSKLFAFARGDKVGFINNRGKVVIKPVLPGPIDNVGDFSEGLARVQDEGYITETGEWRIRGDYSWPRDFSEGLALISSRDFIDPTGKVISPDSKGSIIGPFSGGLAPFEAEGKPSITQREGRVIRFYPGLKGFVDRSGHIAIQPRFAEVGPFVAGLARAVLDGYCHVVTEYGRKGTPTTGFEFYPGVSCPDTEVLPADAIEACASGFIETTRRFAIAPRFEAVLDFNEGLAAVRLEHLWGFIDTAGEIAIKPQFDGAQSFSDGLAAVLKNERWGFIDKTGRLVMEPKFNGASPFSESLALVWSDGRRFFIDRHGKPKDFGQFYDATPFVNGLAALARSSGRVDYVNTAGKIVFSYVR